jgi:hypothetical protein
VRRSSGFPVLLATAAVALAECSGASAPRGASVSTQGNDRSGGITTTQPTENATALLDEWDTCMRSNGDPNQADPTIDADRVILVTYPTGYNPKVQEGSSGMNNPCTASLTAASAALGGQPPDRDPTTMVEFARCMRANGIPDFPDPTDVGGTYHFPIGIHFGTNGVAIPGPNSHVNPNSTVFQPAQKLCARKVGVPSWGDAPGTAPGSVVDIVHGSDG